MTFHLHRLRWLAAIAIGGAIQSQSSCVEVPMPNATRAAETQITNRPVGHILTNINVWSPDGKWIVYDTRSDPAGEQFDGSTIEIVNVETGEVREVYRSHNGAHCGVATFSPRENRVAFILGPENPTSDWQYGPSHRQGVMVDIDHPQVAELLDARNITPPFTPGALRGGTHVHVFDQAGTWVSSTYEDRVLAELDAISSDSAHDANQRNVAVSVLHHSVRVPQGQRNHAGSSFSVVVTQTSNNPRPGSDDISRACEETWIGTNGYIHADGSRQQHAIAFQGKVAIPSGGQISEVFVVDLPDDLTQAGRHPLEGTATTRPFPPRGTQQRRLTHTANRKYPGLQGPRHWLRSSPDGSSIAFLMRDDDGVAQIWTVATNGGNPIQLTHSSFGVDSAFSWSPTGKSIAYIADHSVFVSDVPSGNATRLTPRTDESSAPRPEACVFSPTGDRIAYVRGVTSGGKICNQIFVVSAMQLEGNVRNSKPIE